MSFRFRQSFTIIPGLRLNVSQHGVSASIGGAPFTLNIGPHGVRGTASIPGTGISFHQDLTHWPKQPDWPDRPLVPPTIAFSSEQKTYTIEQVHSGSTERMTSATLTQVKELICTAQRQMSELTVELDQAISAKVSSIAEYESWERGFLMKRLFKKKFYQRKEVAETAVARVTELEQQLALTKIATSFEIAEEQAEFFYRMVDAFSVLSGVERVWDVQSHRQTDRFRERTTAGTSIERVPVRFALGQCDLIDWDKSVPHMKNAKGGEIFLYPSFLLYRAGTDAFSLLEYTDLKSEVTNLQFHEEDRVPSDTRVIGQTWAKANKDGSPDRRFANNREIPIVAYGKLCLKSATGLWEEFHVSKPLALFQWNLAVAAYRASLAGLTKEQIGA